MDLIKFSQKTKRDADELLEYGKVITTLSKYGDAKIIGSYKYDLMWGPDIDVVITTNSPEQASYNCLKDFIEQRKFQKYQLGDFIKYPRKNRPDGIIIVLIHEFEGRKWEIEIWFSIKPPVGDVSKKLENLLTNVSSTQKEAILSLKYKREIDKTSKHKLDSPTIYKKVLGDGM